MNERKKEKEMTKREFIKRISEETDFKQVNITEIFNAAERVLTDTVRSGEDVSLFRWLKVETEIKPEREGRNPQTGETIVIPEHRVVKGKFTKAFRDAVQ